MHLIKVNCCYLNHKFKSKIEEIEDIEILRFFEFEKKLDL